ncbi:hypothetical protein BASA83_004659 [Batrachochytrium salamandrivorans]|nr:hypothetical protein BASA83_004659 [Batrachochytrium salamandrivorans]
MTLVLSALCSLDIPYLPHNGLGCDHQIKSNAKDGSHALHIPSAIARCGSLLCLTVHSSLYVISPDKKLLSAQVELDSPIDALGIYPSRQIAIIGDTLGSIHFVHLLSGEVFYSQALVHPSPNQPNKSLQLPVFACLDIVSDEGVDEIVISLTSGILLRLSGIDFALIETYLLSGNTAMISQEIQQHVKVETVNLIGGPLETLHHVEMAGNNIYACGTGDSPLTVWSRTQTTSTCLVDSVSRTLVGSSIVRIELDHAFEYLAVLDLDSRLTLFDSASLIAVGRILVDGAVDFCFVNPPLSWDYEETVLAVGSRFVRTRSHESSLDPCELAFISDHTNIQDGSKSMLVQGFKLTAATFMQTVKGLIASYQLDEAETLARSSDLDIQSMYKLHMELLLDEMTKQSPRQDLLSDILLIMGRIKDQFFVVNHCIGAKVRSYDDIQQLIGFSRMRLENEATTGPSSNSFQPLVASIDRISRKLATYTHLHRFDPVQWAIFHQKSLLELIRDAVAVGDCSRALTIWSRHNSDPTLFDSIPIILQEIPATSDASTIVFLIQEFEPYINSPHQRHLLDQWIVDRARLLESQTNRPHDALDLIMCLEKFYQQSLQSKGAIADLSPLSYVKTLLHRMQFRSESGPHSSRVESQKLLFQLRDLTALWNDHDFPMSLQVYEKEQPMSIAMLLLDRVAASELIPDAVNKHVKVYLARHDDLTLQAFLAEYCITVMDASIGRDQIFYAWEARVLAIIPLIGDSNIESNIVLEIMRRTSIPWSADLDAQIQKVRLCDTSTQNNRDVAEQFRLMKLKKMMLKYDITSFNIANLSLAKRLLRHICKQTSELTAVHDALQVVKAYHHLTKMDVYIMRARFLLTEGFFKRCTNLLSIGCEVSDFDSMDKPMDSSDDVDQQLSFVERSFLSQQLLGWVLIRIDYVISQGKIWMIVFYSVCIYQLNIAFSNSVLKEDYSPVAFSRSPNIALLSGDQSGFSTMVQAGISLCEIISKYYITAREFPSLRDFQRIQNISCEYNQMLHPRCIMDPAAAQALLEDRILSQSFSNGSDTFVDIYTFADALGIDRSVSLRRLAVVLAHNAELDLVMFVCKELNDSYPGAKSASTFATCCKIILSSDRLLQFEKGSAHILELAQSLVLLGRIALINSDPTDLRYHLDLYKDLDFLCDIVIQGDMGAYRASLTKRRRILPLTRTDESSSSALSAYGDERTHFRHVVPIAHETPSFQDERFGASVFQGFYHETGLVLNTQTVLEHGIMFVRSTMAMNEALSREIDDPFGVDPGYVGKGKMSSDQVPGSQLAHFHGAQLVDICLQHRQYQLALRLSQRLVELSYSPLSEVASNSTKVSTLASQYSTHSETALQYLATQMLSAKLIDRHYALACLVSLPTKLAFEAFKGGMATTGKDFSRLECVAKVGAMAGLIWSQHDFQTNCQRLAVHARWWQELQLLDISFDQARYQASNNGDYQRELLPQFLLKTGGDLETVLEFASYYHIEDDFVYFHLVKQQLFNGLNEAHYAPGDIPKHHIRIASVMTDISNKDKFVQLLLDECIQHISCYNYEDIRFINEQVLRIDTDQRQAKNAVLVLDILRTYQRISPPTFDELQIAYNAMTTSTDKPTAPVNMAFLKKECTHSHARLPFHTLLKDPWVVLTPEICDESLSRLVPVCYVLDLDPDKLHLTLINSKISTLKSLPHNDYDAVTIRGIKCSDFRTLVSKIKDNEQAVTTAVLVGGSFSCGTDRIAMYKLAVQLVDRWLVACKSDLASEEITAKVDVTLNRLKKMVMQAETEFQLRSNKLAVFVPQAHSPLDLCVSLYKHGATALPVPQCNIHDVIEGVAKRSLLKLDDIQMLVLTRLVKLEVPEDDKTSSKVDTWMRVRALLALLRLTKASDMEEMSNKGVWHYIQMTMYLKEFQDLNIVQSLQYFDQCDKGAFVRSLWLSHHNNVKGLRLICKICIDYEVIDGELLYNVLSQLGQKQDVCVFVYICIGNARKLGSVVSVSVMGWIGELWTLTLQDAFRNWFRTFVSPDRPKIDEYLYLLSLLVKSPYGVLQDSSEFIGIFSHMPLSLELRFFTVISLGHLPSGLSSRSEAITKQLSELDGASLVSFVDAMCLPSGSDMYPRIDSSALVYAKDAVVHGIMHILNSRKLFGLVLASKHLELFVQYLVQADEASSLLVATIKSDRIEQAFMLLTLYCSHHKLEGLIKEKAERDTIPVDLSMLQYYVETHQEELGSDADLIVELVRASKNGVYESDEADMDDLTREDDQPKTQ